MRQFRSAFVIGAAVLVLLAAMTVADAQEPKTRVIKGSFEDAKFELNNAIVARGLNVETTGNLGDMLKRTGPDVGSTKPLYAHAEFLTFCSAKYSRQMMEADLGNIAYCPYVIFLYEAANKPGEVVIGYRPPAPRGDDASKAALAAIDKLLEGIIADAAK